MRSQVWLTIILVISFGFLLLSYIPNLYEASVVNLLPGDRTMLWGEHIYTYDYNVYLSKIRQGMERRWSVVDKYDNNPNQKGVFLQMLYLFSGKIGGIIHLTPTLTFHLLRTVVSFLWIFTIIYINIYFLRGRDVINHVSIIIGILLSLLAASFPVFYRFNNEWWVGMHMSWWQEMDVLKRISYIPHYTLNYIIIAILSVLLSKSQIPASPAGRPNSNNQTNPNANFLKICILLFFSFFIHPSAGILFLFSWIIYHLIVTTLMRPHQTGYFLRIILFTFILFIVVALPLLYIRFVTSQYPWKSLIEFDKTNPLPFNLKEYILALGPIFFTGILGSIVVLTKKNLKLLPLVTWILGVLIGIVIFQKIRLQSEVRFVQTANHIPLAILSVYFFRQILSFCRERFQTIPYVIIKFITVITVIMTVLLGLTQTYFSIKAQTDFIHQRAVASQPLVPYPSQVMYPLKDFMKAIEWLEKNTSRKDVVLAKITAGNYVPAYSGNFVYLGHNPETPDFWNREAKLNQFFTGTMTKQEAYEFIKEARINYIFYGPQEKDKAVEDIKKYSFLRKVFNSTYVTLYRVD